MIYLGVDGQAKQPVDIKVGVGGEAKSVSKIYAGVGGEAKLVYDNAFDHVLFQPIYAAMGTFTAEHTGTFVSGDIADLVPTYVTTFTASGNTFSLHQQNLAWKWAEVGYLVKAVCADGRVVDLVDYCKATDCEFSINATIYKEMLSYGSALAGASDYIFNTNYAPAWAQSPRTVTAVCNKNSSAGMTLDYFDEGQPAYVKGTMLLEAVNEQYGDWRNRIVINSFTKDGVAINYEWGTWT